MGRPKKKYMPKPGKAYWVATVNAPYFARLTFEFGDKFDMAMWRNNAIFKTRKAAVAFGREERDKRAERR